jgi:hypothetical protein
LAEVAAEPTGKSTEAAEGAADGAGNISQDTEGAITAATASSAKAARISSAPGAAAEGIAAANGTAATGNAATDATANASRVELQQPAFWIDCPRPAHGLELRSLLRIYICNQGIAVLAAGGKCSVNLGPHARGLQH